MMIVSQVGTFALYILSIYYMKDYINVAMITSWSFTLKVFVLTLLSWAPLHAAKYLMERYDPSEE